MPQPASPRAKATCRRAAAADLEECAAVRIVNGGEQVARTLGQPIGPLPNACRGQRQPPRGFLPRAVRLHGCGSAKGGAERHAELQQHEPLPDPRHEATGIRRDHMRIRHQHIAQHHGIGTGTLQRDEACVLRKLHAGLTAIEQRHHGPPIRQREDRREEMVRAKGRDPAGKAPETR